MKKLIESRRSFFQKTLVSGPLVLSASGLVRANPLVSGAHPTPEWRNKNSGMVYRPLGRTGFMVSEIVQGTYPFTDDESHSLFDQSIERGVNYFDCAPAYSNGEVEKNLGRYFKQPGKREKVFLSTKISGYFWIIDGFVKEIMKGLPASEQEALHKKAQDLLEARTVMRPGYHINYFGGQEEQFDKAYLRHVVLQEHGLKNEWKVKIKANARRLLEQSLKRLQTDYVDVLFCPHGCAMPDMMDSEIIRELLTEFKEKGLIRASALSFHNDVTNNLLKATEVGYYDAAMFAYNIANHAALEAAIYKANQSGMGLIAMKVAKLFSMNNQPPWRAEKMHTAIPGDELSVFAKSYLWALQNPNLSCCVSQMENLEQLKDNLQVVGRKVKLGSV